MRTSSAPQTSRRLHRAGDLVRRLMSAIALGASFLAQGAGAQTRTQSLDTGWEFRLAAGDSAATAHPEVTSWHAATVPGTVQTDLMATRLLPDPAWRATMASPMTR